MVIALVVHALTLAFVVHGDVEALDRSPTATLLGSAEAEHIGDELLKHCTRAVRRSGLIT